MLYQSDREMKYFFILMLLFTGAMTAQVTTEKEDGLKMKEGFIDLPGGKTWYQVFGYDKPGIPLIIIHGGPAGAHNYLQPLNQLAADRPVVFYDQLGCGMSKQNNPEDSSLWTIETYVNELHMLIRHLEFEEVHLLAQSWGSIVAVEYILRIKNPAIKSLILSGPILNSEMWIKDQSVYLSALDESLQKIIRDCEASGIYNSEEYQNAMAVYYGKHVCRLNPWPECLNATFRNMNPEIYLYMWGPSEFKCTGTLKSYNALDDLKKIEIPVLLTCGEFDEAAPASVKYYQSKFRNAEIYIFQDASHEHHLEKPEEYFSVLRKFLNRR